MSVWRCGRFELSLERPLVMAILNVTPDSFSDGGRFFGRGLPETDAAVEAGLLAAEDGADIIDVGGESTRPGAAPVSVGEELARVLPVVEALAQGEVPVSIDTRHAEVARACLEAGAAVVNDVSGFRDPEMERVAAASDCGLVVMHMLGEPATMQEAPAYGDVLAEVARYLRARAEALEDAGVAPERIAIDPGIGFGKTVEHNLALLHRLPELAALGYPVLVGVSRKRFIGAVLGGEPRERLEGSLAAAVYALAKGASVVRAHDVAATVKAVRMVAAIEAEAGHGRAQR